MFTRQVRPPPYPLGFIKAEKKDPPIDSGSFYGEFDGRRRKQVLVKSLGKQTPLSSPLPDGRGVRRHPPDAERRRRDRPDLYPSWGLPPAEKQKGGKQEEQVPRDGSPRVAS